MSLCYLISKLVKKLHIPAIKNSSIDKRARVCPGSHLFYVSLGRYSYVGSFCKIINTQIGSFCSIADNCIIGGASHPMEWVSTSPVFHEGKNIMGKNFSAHECKSTPKTIIGSDVWIGDNCLIKAGVKIGNGAVIGMGAVLTKDVGDYEIWAGNPARLIRKRFSDEIINQLSESCWWDWDDEALYQAAPYFNNVAGFLEYQMREG